MLVHFPIALIAVGFLFELMHLFLKKKELCFTKVSYYLLLLGTLATIVTWLSGQLFTSEMDGISGQVRETHELFATFTLVFALITSCLRLYMGVKKKENFQVLKNVAFISYGVTVLSLFLTGFYGGTLVYNYMMPL